MKSNRPLVRYRFRISLVGSIYSTLRLFRKVAREDASEIFRKLALYVLDLPGADGLCDCGADDGQKLLCAGLISAELLAQFRFDHLPRNLSVRARRQSTQLRLQQ